MSLLHSFKNHKSQLNIKTKNGNIELNCKTIIISKNKNLFKKKKSNDTTFDSNCEEHSIKTGNKNWKKISRISNSINILKSQDIKIIKDEIQLDNDLKDYKMNLHKNSILKKIKINNKIEGKKNDIESQKLKKLFKDALIDDKINNTEQGKNNYKEEIAYQIIYNNINPLDIIDKLYKYNPERNIKNEKNNDFIFNTPLKSNGKTLLYIAVQEGKEEIVKYFLKKGLNPKFPSLIDEIEETPLECACRWNYRKIINLLLEKVIYNKKDINKALRINGLSNQVIFTLRNYIKKIDQVSCFC